PEGGTNQRAGVKIEFYNAKGTNTSGSYGFAELSANGQWRQIVVIAPADFDTVAARLYVRAFGNGAILFDDMAIEKTQSAPDIVVLQPRMVAEPGKPVNAKFDI